MVRFSYKTPILDVCPRIDYLTVVLENKIYIHKIEGCAVFDNFATEPNPRGLYAMNVGKIEKEENTEEPIQVVPSVKIGSVEIHNYNTNKKITVKIHRNALDILRISADGKFLASASEMGNVVKVVETETGEVKFHFRTGADMDLVTDMAFTYDNSIQAVAKTNGDIQFFVLLEESTQKNSENPQKNQGKQKNTSSVFKWPLGKLINYFAHDWCITSVKLPPKKRKIFFEKEQYNLTAYDNDGNVHIIDTTVSKDEKKLIVSIKNETKIDFN